MRRLTKEEYYNKVYGSWLGRISGDFVGAPLEFKPYTLIKLFYGELEYYPKPIDVDYVNDDEMYEICSLVALEAASEKKGINLTSKDIAQEWVNLLYKKNFTAEKVALKNLRAGIPPPASGKYRNIYYDAIGAQMRADIWGQISPGLPQIASKYAELDGCISHAGIGIEGEQFIAIMIAQAFFQADIRKNIDTALKYLPSARESLYSRMVKLAIHLWKRYPKDFRTARQKLIQHWHDMRRNIIIANESKFSERSIKFLNRFVSGVHVLPNAGIITLALLYAANNEDPLGRSIGLAASMGLDTDCNCGNIGAIIGAQIGANKIPSKWKVPLQNTFSTYVKGYEKWAIDKLAKRICNIGLKVVEKKGFNTVNIT
ncbi:MAG: hypothetical protein BAJALOKI1v1_1080009 [Promethearchaeota archaeon]|nr:MAG: hypothetical protein BAJALOKI1v1_1080009 [Candidatus Lokiarchaeota archaeon]